MEMKFDVIAKIDEMLLAGASVKEIEDFLTSIGY